MSTRTITALLGAVAVGALLALTPPGSPAGSDPVLPLPSPILPSLEPSPPDLTDPLPDPGDVLPGDDPADPGGVTGPVDPGDGTGPPDPDDSEGSPPGGKHGAKPRPADPDDPGGDRYPHPPFAPINGDPNATLLQRLYDAQAEQRSLRNRIETTRARLAGAEATVRTTKADQAAAQRVCDVALGGVRHKVLSIYKSGAPYSLYVALQPTTGPGIIRDGAQGRLSAVQVAVQRLASLNERLTGAVAERDALTRKLTDLKGQLKQATALVTRYLDRTAGQVPDAGLAVLGDGSLLWPLRGSVTSGYGNRYDPYYRSWQLHAGIDIEAPTGTPIRAAAAGRVTRAGWFGGYGNYSCVIHGAVRGQPLSTCYGHQSKILVTNGQRVRAGQTVGRVGSTGASTGPHLHFEVRLGGRPTDPGLWL